MKALAPKFLATASGALAVGWSLAASAQQSVVVQSPTSPPPPAPGPAPVVVTPPPAPPSPVVVAPSAPQPAEERDYWRPNRYLLMTGLILGGAPYIASMSVAG